MPTFSPDIISAVLAHMNGDHNDDNLLIAQAFGDPDAETSMMVDLDENEGTWVFTVAGDQRMLDVPWSAPSASAPRSAARSSCCTTARAPSSASHRAITEVSFAQRALPLN